MHACIIFLLLTLFCVSELQGWARRVKRRLPCRNYKPDKECASHPLNGCHGPWLYFCKMSCNDCDGKKYEKFFRSLYPKLRCVDIFPTEMCEKWLEKNDLTCYGRNTIHRSCWKTCANCSEDKSIKP